MTIIKQWMNIDDAKGLLFSQLGNSYHDNKPKYAVLNADDAASQEYKNQRRQESSHMELIMRLILGTNIEMTAKGTSFDLLILSDNIQSENEDDWQI